MSAAPARLAGLRTARARIAAGHDADLVVWDPEAARRRSPPATLQHRHKVTPYAGRDAARRASAPTFLRGRDGLRWRRCPRSAATLRTEPLLPRALTMTDFTDLDRPRRASAWAARRSRANDEFFARRRTCSSPAAASSSRSKYTDRGKWMDGWETPPQARRPATTGASSGSACPASIRGVVVDTATSRQLPRVAARSTRAVRRPPRRRRSCRRPRGRRSCRRSPLQGGLARTSSPVDAAAAASRTCACNIYPDGGVARLRVHGEVVPDWAQARTPGEARRPRGGRERRPVARVQRHVLRHAPQPDHARAAPLNMGDGWETKRRRGPGHDWVRRPARRTAARSTRIEVDTNHFKGNSPDTLHRSRAAATGTRDRRRDVARGPAADASSRRTRGTSSTTSSPRAGPFTHVRLNIYPDGGVSRLRLWGRPRVKLARSQRHATSPAPCEALDALLRLRALGHGR